MKSRRLNVSENHLTNSRRLTRSMTKRDSLPIPVDLVMEIFSLLPAKDIGRCRCVSKFWASLLGRPDFTELYFTRSSARLKLLFACLSDNELVFYSSHQPQNPDENSSAIVATYLSHVPMTHKTSIKTSGPINGLACLRGWQILKGRKTPAPVLVLCNPTSGESLTLPKMKTRKRKTDVMSYLGYDPTKKLFKVLFMTFQYRICDDYQVLTLGGGEKLSWRNVECCIPHRPYHMHRWYFVLSSCGFTRVSRGLLMTEKSSNLVTGTSRYFELWVLEDTGKNEWSKHVYVLPPSWETLIAETYLHFVGMIGTSEIVLSYYPYVPPFVPSYVVYYNIERNLVRRVRIQGMEGFKGEVCRVFLNHVENLKLLQAF